MKKWAKWLLVLFILYLILGFIAGFLLNEGMIGLCTQMYCPSPYNSCVFSENAKGNCTSESCLQCEAKKQGFFEVPCNSCSIVKSYFYTFIINYGKECPGLEILQYNGTTMIGERFEIDKSSCRNRFRFIIT
jgi:hypothetical protein